MDTSYLRSEKYTAVYLRSGRVVIVDGTEADRDGRELIIYSAYDNSDNVTFNWEAVEFYRLLDREDVATQIRAETDDHRSMEDFKRMLSEITTPEVGGQYL